MKQRLTSKMLAWEIGAKYSLLTKACAMCGEITPICGNLELSHIPARNTANRKRLGAMIDVLGLCTFFMCKKCNTHTPQREHFKIYPALVDQYEKAMVEMCHTIADCQNIQTNLERY